MDIFAFFGLALVVTGNIIMIAREGDPRHRYQLVAVQMRDWQAENRATRQNMS